MPDPLPDNPTNPSDSNDPSFRQKEIELKKQIDDLNKVIETKTEQIAKIENRYQLSQTRFSRYKDRIRLYSQIRKSALANPKYKVLKSNIKIILDEINQSGKNIEISKAVSNILEKYFRRNWLLPLLGLVLVMAQVGLLFNQNDLLDIQNIKVHQQNQLIEAQRRSSYVFLMGNIMDAVNRELSEISNTQRKLSPQIKGQLISLSNSLVPYNYMINNKITENALSPERGMLLSFLLESNIYEDDLNYIFERSSFKDSYAENLIFYEDTIKKIDLNGSLINNISINNSQINYLGCWGCELKSVLIKSSQVDKLETWWSKDLQEFRVSNSKIGYLDITSENLSREYPPIISFDSSNIDIISINIDTLSSIISNSCFINSLHVYTNLIESLALNESITNELLVTSQVYSNLPQENEPTYIQSLSLWNSKIVNSDIEIRVDTAQVIYSFVYDGKYNLMPVNKRKSLRSKSYCDRSLKCWYSIIRKEALPSVCPCSQTMMIDTTEFYVFTDNISNPIILSLMKSMDSLRICNQDLIPYVY